MKNLSLIHILASVVTMTINQEHILYSSLTFDPSNIQIDNKIIINKTITVIEPINNFGKIYSSLIFVPFEHTLEVDIYKN